MPLLYRPLDKYRSLALRYLAMIMAKDSRHLQTEVLHEYAPNIVPSPNVLPYAQEAGWVKVLLGYVACGAVLAATVGLETRAKHTPEEKEALQAADREARAKADQASRDAAKAKRAEDAAARARANAASRKGQR